MKRPFSVRPARVLRQALCCAVAVVLLVSVASSFTVLKISSAHILHAQNQIQEGVLVSYSETIKMIEKAISDQVSLLMVDDDVWEMLFSDTEKIDFLLIRSVLNKIKGISLLDYVHSIYLYDDAHNYVLADGYYKKETFFDREVFQLETLPTKSVTGIRNVNGETVFSIIYHSAAIFAGNQATVVINVSPQQIAQAIPYNPAIGDVYIQNVDGELIYSSNPSSKTVQLLSETTQMKDGQRTLSLGKEKYLATRLELSLPELTFWVILDYRTATNAKSILISTVLPSVLLVLLAGIVLAAAMTFLLYRPLGKLVRNIPEQKSSSAESEYGIIEEAFRNLESSNNEIRAKYDTASRYQEMYALTEFLINPAFNRKDFSGLLSSLGLDFSGESNILFMIEPENHDNFSLPDAVLVQFPQHIFSHVDKARFALLVNFHEEESGEIHKQFQSIAEWYQKNNQVVYFAESHPFRQIEELFTQAVQCSEELDRKIFWQKNEKSVGKTELTAMQENEQALFDAVRAGDKEQASASIQTIADSYAENYPSSCTDLARYSLVTLAMKVSHMTAKHSSVSWDTADYSRILSLLQCRSLQEIADEICAIAVDVIDSNNAFARNRVEMLVAQAEKYIDDHISLDLSLDMIAQSVYLSTNYFCTLFREETGSTVMDYVAKVKIEKACSIISQDPRILIHSVASQLGYDNDQKFTRQFKKVTGMTPETYRKSCG